MNSTGPSKKVHIKRNFTSTVARYMDVIIPGDFKVVYIERNFALNVFVFTRFHCTFYPQYVYFLCKMCNHYDMVDFHTVAVQHLILYKGITQTEGCGCLV